MARMVPSPIHRRDSEAEVKVYAALERALPADWTVLHHVQWLQKRPGRDTPDGETDFVIVHPEKGALILEVKGGRVRYEAATGTWFTSGHSASDVQIADPIGQARDSTYALHRYLRSLPGWPQRWGPFAYAVCFPDGILAGMPLPHVQPEIVADARDFAQDAAVLGKIERVLAWWPRDRAEAGRRGAEMLVGALAHDIQMNQPLALRVEAADQQIIRLSERQFGVLQMLSGQRRVAVSGPAGSGKTIIAAEKASRLARTGFRTLLTCFNRPLADHLRDWLTGVPNLEVQSFHQLSRSMAIRAKLPLPPGDATSAWWNRVAGLLEPATLKLGAQYDAIVVDEAQDFDEAWWLPLMLTLADPDHGILYVFYDSNQAIYGRPQGLPDGLTDARLWENFRNSKPIFEAVMGYYRNDEAIECLGPDGPPVEIQTCGRAELRRELSRVLHRLVQTERLAPADIVVLTPSNVDRSAVGGQVGAYRLTPTPRGGNDVLLSSIFRFKGLDAKAVVVVEVNRREDVEATKVMYVACSRARSLLVLMFSA
jgi:Nuclease-related domain/AAA domain/UvrD-like helicase C-terminal domain